MLDPEFRPARAQWTSARPTAQFAALLRYELSQRNQKWAADQGLAHEVSLGSVPAVLYREDDAGHHGNFLQASYQCIRQRADWARRLAKVHTSAKRALMSRDQDRCELDSSNSSDALLMNIFCHPDTLASSKVRVLLGVDADADPVFGFKPRVPLRSGRGDCTEIDLRLGDLFVEAKLTEYDFQVASARLIERYENLKDVLDITSLERSADRVQSYQLIRGVLAVHASPGERFCVLCDARRPDLIASWHKVMMAVTILNLRCRLLLLTWQELAAALPESIQLFLERKYGIIA